MLWANLQEVNAIHSNGKEMFLSIIVSAMAIALAAQLFALIGTAHRVFRALQHFKSMKNELSEKLRPSIQMGRELAQSVQPDFENIRRTGADIAATLRDQFGRARELWQDVSRRRERLRLRLNREGVASVEQLQRDRQLVSRGVLKPIRTAASVAFGVRATTWLLRKVA